jgi:hypothetical protein
MSLQQVQGPSWTKPWLDRQMALDAFDRECSQLADFSVAHSQHSIAHRKYLPVVNFTKSLVTIFSARLFAETAAIESICDEAGGLSNSLPSD